MILKREHFQSGEHSTQEYRFFRNEVTGDLVQIIRNKKEPFWFGHFMNQKQDICRPIPVEYSEDPEELLGKVCQWYNNGKPEAESYEVEVPGNTKISKTLLEIENAFGTFPAESAKRIQAYIDVPSLDRWDDISGIIIDGKHSLWQCMMTVDQDFPRQGRSTDATGKVVREWGKTPEPFMVLRAIKTALQQENR